MAKMLMSGKLFSANMEYVPCSGDASSEEARG